MNNLHRTFNIALNRVYNMFQNIVLYFIANNLSDEVIITMISKIFH